MVTIGIFGIIVTIFAIPGAFLGGVGSTTASAASGRCSLLCWA